MSASECAKKYGATSAVVTGTAKGIEVAIWVEGPEDEARDVAKVILGSGFTMAPHKLRVFSGPSSVLTALRIIVGTIAVVAYPRRDSIRALIDSILAASARPMTLNLILLMPSPLEALNSSFPKCFMKRTNSTSLGLLVACPRSFEREIRAPFSKDEISSTWYTSRVHAPIVLLPLTTCSFLGFGCIYLPTRVGQHPLEQCTLTGKCDAAGRESVLGTCYPVVNRQTILPVHFVEYSHVGPFPDTRETPHTLGSLSTGVRVQDLPFRRKHRTVTIADSSWIVKG